MENTEQLCAALRLSGKTALKFASPQPSIRLAILNDHEHLALKLADWSAVQERCDIDVFHRPLSVPDEAAEVLAPYDAICLVRERMAMPASLIERLPRLRYIAATGPWNRTIDFDATRIRNIAVSHTVPRNAGAHATAELAFGLMIAAGRGIVDCDAQLRQGHWGSRVGLGLHGQRLGLIGLGRIGQCMASIGNAFGMEVVAWSQNLTDDVARAVGAQRVSLDELLLTSDFTSLHVIFSERTRGLIGAEQLAMMKRSAILVNTARGPIVDESALVTALREGRIAGAGLDVFDREPLDPEHSLLGLRNVVLTPHLGFSTEGIFRGYFEDSVANVLAWLDGEIVRPLGTHQAQEA